MTATPNALNRRRFLGAAAGGAALLAVGQTERAAAASTAPATYQDLVADPVFYVAHRGGGGDWPEMTNYAYRHAAALPAIQALEVSVRLTADNVLVCTHDDVLTRTTGVAVSVAASTWSDLSTLLVDASETSNPFQLPRKFSRFSDVLKAFGDTFVLYVEPKSSAANAPLMKAMVDAGQPERVVWKQPVNSSLFGQAKDNGFATWGYVLNESGHLGDNLKRYAASPDIDMLGAPRTQSDAFVSAIVDEAEANDKRTMMWEIRSVADRARALRLGCTGLMTSQVVEVTSVPL